MFNVKIYIICYSIWHYVSVHLSLNMVVVSTAHRRCTHHMHPTVLWCRYLKGSFSRCFHASALQTILLGYHVGSVHSSAVVMLSQQFLKCKNCSFLLWNEVTIRERYESRLSAKVREHIAFWRSECTHTQLRVMQ